MINGTIIATGDDAEGIRIDGASFTSTSNQVINTGTIRATDAAIVIGGVDIDPDETHPSPYQPLNIINSDGVLRDAKWWGLSGLAGYKLTPRLQALVRLDYLNNRKNGGGVYGASLEDNGTGTYIDGISGFGPSIDNSTGMAVDPSRGVNRYALSTGLNYLLNDNTSLKFEVRYDRANGNVFLDSKTGLYKKSNVLVGGAIVFQF